MKRSCKYKSKDIRNFIFVQFYYYCSVLHILCFFVKKKPVALMLNIYNAQSKMCIVYYLMSA